jgi:hypothetical protein
VHPQAQTLAHHLLDCVTTASARRAWWHQAGRDSGAAATDAQAILDEVFDARSPRLRRNVLFVAACHTALTRANAMLPPGLRQPLGEHQHRQTWW